ncbi:hypothetical protein [Peribacillus muralis]|uniref:hypothetical protein n=1 Tax=Peribacillus muralis TaxID=264697 RepID=UPI003CFC9653
MPFVIRGNSGTKFHSCDQSNYGYEESYPSLESAEKEMGDLQAFFYDETFSVVEVSFVEKII